MTCGQFSFIDLYLYYICWLTITILMIDSMISYDARPLGLGGQHWSDSKLHDRIAFTLRSRCAPSHWIISIHKKISSARESLPSRYFTFTRRTRASIGSLFLESWMSLFFQEFLCHISIFWLWMQEEFNCAWLQKFVQSFSSPACWHIFTQPRIFVQIRRRKTILSTLLYLFSFL